MTKQDKYAKQPYQWRSDHNNKLINKRIEDGDTEVVYSKEEAEKIAAARKSYYYTVTGHKPGAPIKKAYAIPK